MINKYSLSLVFIIAPLIAENKKKDSIILSTKKIVVKSGMTYGGFVTGLMGGMIAGSCSLHNEDSIPTMGIKLAVCAAIGATCGAIGGKNVGHKYIEYYYPDKNT